jgi:hypothetical protein
MRGCGINSSGTGWGSVVGSCECRNKGLWFIEKDERGIALITKRLWPSQEGI